MNTIIKNDLFVPTNWLFLLVITVIIRAKLKHANFNLKIYNKTTL